MATAYITMGPVATTRLHGELAIFVGNSARNETVTTSGTSAQGSLVAQEGDSATVFCDTAVYAATGTNPTAAAGAGVFCPGGFATPIALKAGEKIALIDV